jgi:uncharacterized protein
MNPESPPAIEPQLLKKQTRLIDFLKTLQECVVAFSGGVDSAVVAKAAVLALGQRSKAVMAISPSVASGEVDQARMLANEMGIEFEVIETHETVDPRYIQNDKRRCYYCKQELYQRLTQLAEQFPKTTILNGTNTDDLGDYRPGLEAAKELGVLSPLVEAGINKLEVRLLARHWNLGVWDKPATPCLSSRIAYGETVTPERLSMIDQAESILKSLGFVELRVRYHSGDLARIEVPESELLHLVKVAKEHQLEKRFQELGFRFVTLDLVGFRSGSLNTLVQISTSTL